VKLKAALAAVCLSAACGGTAAPAPPATPTPPQAPPQAPPPGSTPATQITGAERIGWTQTAPDIRVVRFAMYIDSTQRVELTTAVCAPGGEATFNCDAALPPLTSGRHSLEIVAWIESGGSALESARAEPIAVDVVGGSTSSTVDAGTVLGQTRPQSEPPAGPPEASSCGIARAGAEVVTWGSTGTLSIMEPTTGAVRPLTWARSDDAGWTPGALAAHPDFAKNGWIYLAQMTHDGEARLRLVRYRKKGDVLGERAILFEYAPKARPARLRLSTDGHRLYLAMLAGHATGPTDSAVTPSRFLIRLLLDGRVPAENAGGSVFADVVASRPIEVAWSAEERMPWVIEQTDAGRYSVSPGRLHDSAPAPGSAFSATSVPIAAQFASREGETALWVVLANGELLSLDGASAGGPVRLHRPLFAMPRAVGGALVLAEQDMVICGPTAAAGYGAWRVRFRN
jgi:hypothetical protein